MPEHRCHCPPTNWDTDVCPRCGHLYPTHGHDPDCPIAHACTGACHDYD